MGGLGYVFAADNAGEENRFVMIDAGSGSVKIGSILDRCDAIALTTPVSTMRMKMSGIRRIGLDQSSFFPPSTFENVVEARSNQALSGFERTADFEFSNKMATLYDNFIFAAGTRLYEYSGDKSIEASYTGESVRMILKQFRSIEGVFANCYIATLQYKAEGVSSEFARQWLMSKAEIVVEYESNRAIGMISRLCAQLTSFGKDGWHEVRILKDDLGREADVLKKNLHQRISLAFRVQGRG